MTLIHRHERCIGLTIWKWGQTLIELWFAPSGYEVKPHLHKQQNIRITYLFGRAMFAKKYGDSSHRVFVSWPLSMFMRFNVRHDEAHYFKVFQWPLIFLNKEKYLHSNPTSTAIDFTLVEDKF